MDTKKEVKKTRPMRVFIAVPSYWPSQDGVANITGYLAEGLARRGHEILVFTSAGNGGLQELPYQERHEGVLIERMRVFVRWPLVLRGRDRKSTKGFYRRRIASFAPDVLIVVCSQTWTMDWLHSGLDKIKCPKVFYSHGYSNLKETYRIGEMLRKRNVLGAAEQYLCKRYYKNLYHDISKYDLAIYLSKQSNAAEYAREHMLINGKVLENAIDELQGLSDDEYMDTLVDILGGDPAVYGQYFPEMVQTSVNKIYPIENYGSAMTPFYTVLAIWVGGVILSSLVKIHARTEGLVNPKSAELYFGRYLFFFVLSQIQAAVIVTGDLFLLKVQCLHPGMMYLTGALTAFTFSLLIYSLAISFGDVGKAIVVVIMVMQIAGSSGTFPIELLPEIYQKIYRFFPFPYAIDAMRECICGLYGDYYITQLAFLLLFAVAALLIGLLVRRPLMGLNHFMEEKLEETELL